MYQSLAQTQNDPHPRHKYSTMARKKALRLGVGAQCSPLLKNVHPQNIVAEVFPVYAKTERLLLALVTRKGPVTRRGRSYVGVFFDHPQFEGKEIYCAARYANPVTEGDPTQFFDTPSAEVPAPSGNPEPRNEIQPEVLRAGNNSEDIAMVRGQGLDVDDDNEPAPENVLTDDGPIENPDDGLYPNQTWGMDSFVDPMNNDGWTKPPGFHNDFNIRSATWLELFFLLFPITWFRNVLIPKTNENLKSDVSFGEMLRYIGLRLRMASVGGAFKKDDYWSTREFDGEDEACPYNFRQYMSKTRFDSITSGLFFTDAPKPTFVDKFWEVRQMIDEWNKNMAAVFFVWMRACPSGTTDGHVLAGYFALVNLTLSAMSITLHVALCVVFFSPLNSFRGKTIQ